MKKRMIPGIFLVLILLNAGMLRAQAPGGEASPVSIEQARRGDDLGQSSTVTAALPEVKTYEELRHAISEARVQSRVRAEKAVENERVREAWEIGRLIDAHVLQHKERADYDRQVIPRLAADLGMSRTELSYMLQFARAHSIFPHAEKLSWSDYRELLSVNDPEERKAVAEQAEKEGWSRDRLRAEVKALKGTGSSAESGVPVSLEEISLSPSTPSKPGTYRVILAKTGPYAGELAIDLGFSNYVRLAKVVEDVNPFKEGEIIEFSDEQDEVRPLPESPATEAAAGKRGASPESRLFTYRAWVHRILDGDTLEAVVDLGFGITTTQTLRLRGIDAPEIQTRDGIEAKKFVESVIASTPGAKQSQGDRIAASSRPPAKSPILIRTVKSDKYDRYLADVYFLDAKGQEVYMNNVLLEQGHAVRVSDS